MIIFSRFLRNLKLCGGHFIMIHLEDAVWQFSEHALHNDRSGKVSYRFLVLGILPLSILLL